MSHQKIILGSLDTIASAVFVELEPGQWSLTFPGKSQAASLIAQPVVVEWYQENETVRRFTTYYSSVLSDSAQQVIASAVVALTNTASIGVEDQWSIREGMLVLVRQVRVQGNAAGGFLSAQTFYMNHPCGWSDVQPFAPGMLYGDTHLINPAAIGSAAHYQNGVRDFRIREDRLSAPLFGLHFADNSSLTLLHRAPDARTSPTEARDLDAVPMIDEAFQFAALGGFEEAGQVGLGCWFPGTEGEVTYRGDTFPGGQLRQWRRRYHPLRDGLVQRYELALRIGQEEPFTDYVRNVWRWAWQFFQPAVYVHSLEQARPALVAQLASMVIEQGDVAGLPLAAEATTGEVLHTYSLMGFTARVPDVAYYFLHEASRSAVSDSQRYRELGTKILDAFCRIPMNPPQAEGFDLKTGLPVTFRFPGSDQDLLYIRSLGEGCKSMLKAWQHEQAAGRAHPDWLSWCVSFGDWMLAQQTPEGGFPRAFLAQSGLVGDASLTASYNMIPCLVLLTEATHDPKYLQAAARAGAYLWDNGQHEGRFVGGTIDNPNVIDKEAGMIALEGYLLLYQATGESVWLDRARAAADYAETWIYIWNVPIVGDPADLHWKSGVPTVGLQLIATGHSLVDCYSAFDAASYAKLYRFTGDLHYRQIALILLHNTLLMTALPNHPYDLAGIGWQQEHWSLAPRRGCGMHRYWLPWVPCSHLQSMTDLEDFDSTLWNELKAPDTAR